MECWGCLKNVPLLKGALNPSLCFGWAGALPNSINLLLITKMFGAVFLRWKNVHENKSIVKWQEILNWIIPTADKWLTGHRLSGYFSHLSNKSVCKMSALLELTRSTVSAVIVKLRRLVASTAQLRSGRPHKLTERDRRGLTFPNHLQHSLPSSKLPLEATSAQ